MSHIIPKQAILLAAALLYALPALSEDLAQRAQAYLSEQAVEHGLPGVSAAIAVDGAIVWTGGAGYRDVANEIPADGEMVHRIASITKSMTAAAVMQLVESGKVELEDRLRRHVSTYPKKKRGVIRIEHLLAHTSGTKHYLGKENRPYTHFNSLEDAMAVFRDRPLAFEPGRRYLYTTYGYTVLGAVIESASEMSYADYMQSRIWDPAGMTKTQVEIHGEEVPGASKLYRRESDGTLVEDDDTDLSIKVPGGGLLSTAGDLVRFALAFEAGGLVSAETRERMLQVPVLSDPVAQERRRVPYALGWIVGDSERFGNYIRNDGGQSGTSTNLLVSSERGVIVAVLSNIARHGGEVAGLTNDLAAIAAGLD